MDKVTHLSSQYIAIKEMSTKKVKDVLTQVLPAAVSTAVLALWLGLKGVFLTQ